ncbi:hypothetical protein [Helicobacter cetorum]|uniref:Uncharacterized protein n=1 Tax=Helicobacter cetorum (strain ATCC BAA-429 / MIT 00-7128) TaxID=182217 RepID=I0EME2_HELC0|nr:hypothetical protein [Helicobacter cetorum]AFI04111.1 hypothetical protein HCW_04210 [Helicobacter cetorum MIT 00-7128]
MDTNNTDIQEQQGWTMDIGQKAMPFILSLFIYIANSLYQQENNGCSFLGFEIAYLFFEAISIIVCVHVVISVVQQDTINTIMARKVKAFFMGLTIFVAMSFVANSYDMAKEKQNSAVCQKLHQKIFDKQI